MATTRRRHDLTTAKLQAMVKNSTVASFRMLHPNSVASVAV